MSLSILPECYGDTEMIKILGFQRANHCSSIGEVANSMRTSYKGRLAIGIIDNDKSSIPSYFNAFQRTKIHENFEVKDLPGTKHYILVLKLALEKFLLNVANNLGVSIEKYGFKNLKSIQRVTKSQHISKNQQFKNFVNNLKQKKASPLSALKKEIQKLMDENG